MIRTMINEAIHNNSIKQSKELPFVNLRKKWKRFEIFATRDEAAKYSSSSSGRFFKMCFVKIVQAYDYCPGIYGTCGYLVWVKKII